VWQHSPSERLVSCQWFADEFKTREVRMRQRARDGGLLKACGLEGRWLVLVGCASDVLTIVG
jgi:hypothetical protein